MQEELRTAATPQKPFIVSQIKALNRQIALKRAELNDCLIQSGAGTPLSTIFAETATLTTSFPQALGPFVNEVTLGFLFNAARTEVLITSFPPISFGPFDTPIGANVLTITKIGGRISH